MKEPISEVGIIAQPLQICGETFENLICKMVDVGIFDAPPCLGIFLTY